MFFLRNMACTNKAIEREVGTTHCKECLVPRRWLIVLMSALISWSGTSGLASTDDQQVGGDTALRAIRPRRLSSSTTAVRCLSRSSAVGQGKRPYDPQP